MNLLKFALRNTRRNTRRTVLTALAIGIAVAALTFMDAYLRGVVGGIFETFVQLDAGSIKIVPKKAVDRSRPLPLDQGIKDVSAVVETVASVPGVEAVSPRIKFPVLLDSDGSSVPAFGIALQPSRERSLMNLDKFLVEGSLPADSSWGVLLGIGLAKKLGLKVGDELFMVTSDSYGGLGPGLYNVSGLVESGVGYIDKKMFYVTLFAAQDQLAMDNQALEIACRTEGDLDENLPVAVEVNRRLTESGYTDVVALPWQQQGNLYETFSTVKFAFLIIMFLLGIIALTTVVNTVLMSVMERTREIGALRALGFTRGTVLRMIVSESLLIGILGTLGGIALGMTVALILQKTGINIGGAADAIALPLRPVIHPDPRLITAVKSGAFGILITLISAWFPARMAVKLQPVKALRTN